MAQRPRSVLDVGCGTGKAGRLLAKGANHHAYRRVPPIVLLGPSTSDVGSTAAFSCRDERVKPGAIT